MIHTAETILHRMFGLMIPTKVCVRSRGAAVIHVDVELGFFLLSPSSSNQIQKPAIIVTT